MAEGDRLPSLPSLRETGFDPGKVLYFAVLLVVSLMRLGLLRKFTLRAIVRNQHVWADAPFTSTGLDEPPCNLNRYRAAHFTGSFKIVSRRSSCLNLILSHELTCFVRAGPNLLKIRVTSIASALSKITDLSITPPQIPGRSAMVA